MADKPRTTGLTQRWQYRVRLGAMEAAYFQKGNLPSKEIEESTFKPAGLIFDEKYPGRIKYNDITLEKGSVLVVILKLTNGLIRRQMVLTMNLVRLIQNRLSLSGLIVVEMLLTGLFCMKPGARRLNMTTLVMVRLM